MLFLDNTILCPLQALQASERVIPSGGLNTGGTAASPVHQIRHFGVMKGRVQRVLVCVQCVRAKARPPLYG